LLPLRITVQNPILGEKFDFSVELTRSGQTPLAQSFQLEIVEEKQIHEPRDPQKPEHKGVNLPEVIVVRENPSQNEESWSTHQWSGENIAKVEPGRIYVNMDSNDLKNYLTKCPKNMRVLAETIYKTGVYLNSIILDLELGKIEALNGHKNAVFNGSISSVSKTLLPLYLDPQIQKLAQRE